LSHCHPDLHQQISSAVLLRNKPKLTSIFKFAESYIVNMPDINKDMEFIIAILKTGSITVNYDAAREMLGWNKKKVVNKMSEFRTSHPMPSSPSHFCLLSPTPATATGFPKKKKKKKIWFPLWSQFVNLFEETSADDVFTRQARRMTGPLTRMLPPPHQMVQRQRLPSELLLMRTAQTKSRSQMVSAQRAKRAPRKRLLVRRLLRRRADA
jgi:hypothetical protein